MSEAEAGTHKAVITMIGPGLSPATLIYDFSSYHEWDKFQHLTRALPDRVKVITAEKEGTYCGPCLRSECYMGFKMRRCADEECLCQCRQTRPFTLQDGTVIDLNAVPDGHGVCFVCGIVPRRTDGQGCTHP